MLSIFSKGLFRIGNYLIKKSDFPKREISTSVHTDHEQQHSLWIADKGDKTHRLNYNLNEKSTVFDLGGYEGQWASDVFSKYVCNIYIFEPYQIYAQNIEHRFKNNNKIMVFPFGLSNSNRDESLSISEDSSSIFKKGNNIVSIKLLNASEFIAAHQISKIELMKINIEGGEYELLDHLIDSNTISIIENIQVQFHNFIPYAEVRMRQIQDRLSLTHQLTYQYKFVWENWKRKNMQK
jgi:FkbM family methyltransferase